MSLSSELISQFVKATKDSTTKTSETTLYATTVMYDGKLYVKLDGSDLLTPVQTTSSVNDGDRVTVLIKDHTATVTGNITDPSASGNVVKEQNSKISEFEVIMAYKVTTEDLEAITATIQSLYAKTAVLENATIVNAEIEALYAKFAELDHVNAETIEALNADIEKLRATFAEIDDLTVEELDAINAEINNLRGYTADFTYVSADVLEAIKAQIKELEVKKLSATEAEIKYANIDFANIGEAAIKEFLSKSGIIEDLIVSEGHVTGKLVGVTIIGDLIEGGTVKADKLVILGEDGLYYKLNTNGVTTSAKQTEYNSLNGSIITAKSITAEKVAVDDLVAFDATIGGFNITEDSLYSGVKKSVDNSTSGVYLDSKGQMALGDSDNYIRYYIDEDGTYKLVISANSILLKTSNKTVEEAIEDITVGGRNLIRNSETMIFTDYYFEETPPIDSVMIVDENGYVLLDEKDDFLITYPDDESVIVTYSDGNVRLVNTTLIYDDNGNVMLQGLKLTYDDGNVVTAQ